MIVIILCPKRKYFKYSQGPIFRSENNIYLPPPSENDVFSPSCDTSFFDSHHGLFVLILPYFAIILPLYFPFYPFTSPFFIFFPLFPLSVTFPSFSLHLFIFFPQMTLADIPPPPLGGEYFPIYRPLSIHTAKIKVTL